MILQLIIASFYLILPAYGANMAPVIFGKLGLLKFFARPIDGGRRLGQEFIFGSGKTWRGVIAAVIISTLTAGGQAILWSNHYFYSISLIDYPADWLIFGFFAGLGAIGGDLIKSFFKRRINIASGKSWPVFDQWDFIVGFFIATGWFFLPSVAVIATIFIMTLVLHPLTNIVGYLLKIKKVWW